MTTISSLPSFLTYYLACLQHPCKLTLFPHLLSGLSTASLQAYPLSSLTIWLVYSILASLPSFLTYYLACLQHPCKHTLFPHLLSGLSSASLQAYPLSSLTIWLVYSILASIPSFLTYYLACLQHPCKLALFPHLLSGLSTASLPSFLTYYLACLQHPCKLTLFPHLLSGLSSASFQAYPLSSLTIWLVFSILASLPSFLTYYLACLQHPCKLTLFPHLLSGLSTASLQAYPLSSLTIWLVYSIIIHIWKVSM